jgi:hypothetical protein
MKFLSVLKMWFHQIFDRIRPLMEETVEPTIHALEFIKMALNSPEVDVLASISGKAWPEEVKAWLLKAIPSAITTLRLIDLKPHPSDPADPNSPLVEPTAEDYIKALLSNMSGISEDQRAMILHKIASTMLRVAHSDMSAAEADTIVQMAYMKLKEANLLGR